MPFQKISESQKKFLDTHKNELTKPQFNSLRANLMRGVSEGDALTKAKAFVPKPKKPKKVDVGPQVELPAIPEEVKEEKQETPEPVTLESRIGKLSEENKLKITQFLNFLE